MVSIRIENKQSVNHPPCIWMQAGVVPKKFCRLDYQWAACAYDRAMRRIGLAWSADRDFQRFDSNSAAMRSTRVISPRTRSRRRWC